MSHHAAAVRLIHVQLADGASSSAVLRALSSTSRCYARGKGAAADGGARPHPSRLAAAPAAPPPVAGRRRAAHPCRQLILGAHATNQAVSSILLQAILSRLKETVAPMLAAAAAAAAAAPAAAAATAATDDADDAGADASADAAAAAPCRDLRRRRRGRGGAARGVT